MTRKVILYGCLLAIINYIYSTTLNWINSTQSVWAVLMILVIPLVLFFAYRDFMIHRWQFRLPFGKAFLSGLLIVMGGAVLLATLHYLNEQFFHILGAEGERNWPKAVWDFVSWYFLFALFGIPVAYFALRLKLRIQYN